MLYLTQRSNTERAIIALYVFELGVLFVIVGLYKAPSLSPFPSIFLTKFGFVVALGFIVCSWGLRATIQEWKKSRRGQSNLFKLSLITHTLSVVLALTLAEAMLRIIAVEDAGRGVRVGDVYLRPTWQDVQTKIRSYVRSAVSSGSWSSYFIHDEDLGWTVGPNRSSKDGMYHSSAKGLRSLSPNVQFAKERPKYRIALVGDSNVFSLEVAFQDSWGYILEQLLGRNFQVLNFGVDGYGIDQAYLRFRRDVRSWQPDLVIFGFIQHDMIRSMAVYTFVSFPSWQLPFAKPRFVLAEGNLALLNPNPMNPSAILSIPSIHELPHIAFDLGYNTTDWAWRFERMPIMLRYLTSVFPRWPEGGPQVSDEATEALNSRLLQEFFHLASVNGRSPLLVYFPTIGAGDFLVQKDKPNLNLARRTIRRSGLPFFDLTTCLEKINLEERWVPSGSHFSAVANAAIAKCIAPRLLELLDQKG